ncbi:MAG: UMP kinase [Patescibacteria group bacterium]
MSKTFVLSVGGSLVVTKAGIDISFLKKFRNFILAQAKLGHKFYLVVGGGATARTYIQAALAVAPADNSSRDWVGIRATRLNAQLLKAIFGAVACPAIVTNPTKPIKTSKKIVLVAGYKPGWSTDHVAVLLAKHNKIGTVINLSNIDYAYDHDPRQFPRAKKLIRTDWPAFRKIVGNRWQPGLNVPFDPIASREAAKHRLKVIILNGKKLRNLAACLADRRFQGTTIS